MEDKIIQALRLAVVSDIAWALTAEQCDRLLDMLALKNEAIDRLTTGLERAEKAIRYALSDQTPPEIIPDYEHIKDDPNSPWLQED